MNSFFYGGLPYIAFTVFLLGTIVRFAFFERGWTTKSSEFLEKKQVRFAVPIFHIGLVMALGGHLIGILVPKFVTRSWAASRQVSCSCSASCSASCAASRRTGSW